MRKLIAFALVAGCTQMSDYYQDAELVEVSGRVFFVAPRPQNGPGVYLAGPNEPGLDEVLTGRDMTLPQANVAAIEAVTGCVVVRETVRNQDATTYAAVSC
ncbi:hypothetical protein [Phaeobacter gallaeciensis]|uniref:hypothetical protein n=1 Tax=Phaeobacter gallaeciensis TaxID=60890 RepID=UPI00237F93AD|nr:hypothetical protein [Phaeobacter gallaeciensis]MDE4059748.1 hypothetical protein [Phaeobacter gallaeciensis]MDE4122615.1 hypothetical protein [Phaeobacter gallaeciensis]MDE4127235.1 hypothetical protein [Phaeobacter gallaeciensis]